MGLTTYEWGPRVQHEANKCWFISLAFSILLSLHGLSSLFASSGEKRAPTIRTENGKASDSVKKITPDTTDGATDEKQNDKSNRQPALKGGAPDLLRSKLYTQLIIDSCDICIPGSAVGWLTAGPILVGTLMTVSTTLAGRQIWIRVQEKARQA